MKNPLEMNYAERKADMCQYLHNATGYTKTSELAKRYGVTVKTIQRDLNDITAEHNLESKTGGYGGFKLDPNDFCGVYFKDEYENALEVLELLEDGPVKDKYYKTITRLGPSKASV